MASNTEASHLLSSSSKPAAAGGPTWLGLTATKDLSILRVLIGASSLIAPQPIFRLFRLPLAPQAVVVARLFGIRELVLGELTWLGKPSLEQKPEGTRVWGEQRAQIKTLLWANVAVDVVDIGSCAVAVASGVMSRPAGALIGGGALVGVLLGTLGLRGM